MPWGIVTSLLGAVGGGGRRPSSPRVSATPPSSSQNVGSGSNYLAYLAQLNQSQVNQNAIGQSTFFGQNQSNAQSLALAGSGERSQMTTFVVLGVVMLGIAGLVALSRR